MLVMMMVFSFTLILLFIFYIINFFLSVKDFYKNKVGSFESGFVSIGKVQNSFSIHFFIMMLMFVIFDLEIVMFLGLLISSYINFLTFFFIMFFIMFGFYMEWFYGKLVWLV